MSRKKEPCVLECEDVRVEVKLWYLSNESRILTQFIWSTVIDCLMICIDKYHVSLFLLCFLATWYRLSKEGKGYQTLLPDMWLNSFDDHTWTLSRFLVVKGHFISFLSFLWSFERDQCVNLLLTTSVSQEYLKNGVCLLCQQ